VAHQWIDLHRFRRSGTSAASARRSRAAASAGASALVKGGGAGTHRRHGRLQGAVWSRDALGWWWQGRETRARLEHRWRAARRPAHGQQAAFIAGQLPAFTTKGTRFP
jgi:hypothetical protein